MDFDLGSLVKGGISGIIDSAASVADRFITTSDEKNQFRLELEKVAAKKASDLEKTVQTIAEARSKFMIAELQNGDTFTKRARPSVVYAGLAYIGINHVLFPILMRICALFKSTPIDPSLLAPLPDLPHAFWTAWGGICASWVISRSWERVKGINKITKTITGS